MKALTEKRSSWVAFFIVSKETFEDDDNKNRETDGRFLGLNAFYIKDAKEYFYGGLGN